MGIKETKEVLAAIKILSVTGVKTFGDGIQISDLRALSILAKEYKALEDAVKGIDQVDDEIKDIDIMESQELLAAVFDIVKSIKEAAKK
jgi:hypothetical protein